MNTFNGNSRRLFVMLLLSLMIFIILLLSGVWSVMAQDDLLPLPLGGGNRAFTQVQQLTPSDANTSNRFGFEAALDDDTLIAASPYTGSTGAAYIFERSDTGTWNEIVRLTGSDTLDEDYFGNSVSIQGTTIVVGAPGHDTDAIDEGAAYIFTRDTSGVWSQSQKLTLPGTTAGAYFGERLDLEGDRLAITALYANTVYLFKRDASQMWQLEADILLGARASDVDLHDQKLLIGASGANTTGEAYLYQFEAGGWALAKTLTADDKQGNDYFGIGVSLQDDQAFVGAYLGNPTDNYRGGIYVFSNNGGTWNQTQKLLANDGSVEDSIGRAFAVDGDTLAVGSYGDSSFFGSIYLFDWNGSAWIQQNKIPAVGGAFGFSVALQDDTLVSGAPYADTNQGRVYIYRDPSLLPTELLVDGGFENDGTGWNIKNATSDKVKCNKTGKVIAHAGNCAWRFKGGAGENSKIQQVITSGFTAGDTLTLSGYINGSGSANAKIKFVVSYLNASLDKRKLGIDLLSATGGSYIPFSDFSPALITNVIAPPEKIKVQVKNNSTSGKVYIDSLSLTVQ